MYTKFVFSLSFFPVAGYYSICGLSWDEVESLQITVGARLQLASREPMIPGVIVAVFFVLSALLAHFESPVVANFTKFTLWMGGLFIPNLRLWITLTDTAPTVHVAAIIVGVSCG